MAFLIYGESERETPDINNTCLGNNERVSLVQRHNKDKIIEGGKIGELLLISQLKLVNLQSQREKNNFIPKQQQN